MKLHDEMSARSGSKPAGYIRTAAFKRFTLNKLSEVARLFNNQLIPAGTGELSARLNNFLLDPTAEAALSYTEGMTSASSTIDFLVKPSFEVPFDVVLSKAPNTLITKLVVNVSEVRVHMRAENNNIVLEGASIKSTQTFDEFSNDVELVNAGIDPREGARVAGLLGYGVVVQAIQRIFSKRVELSLARIFPLINFGSNILLAILDEGNVLGIFPSSIATINSDAHCLCGAGPDLKSKPTQTTTGANPTVLETIELGGPLAENKDPLTDFGPRVPDQSGLAGLYIPLEFANDFLIKSIPTVTIEQSDSGLFNYEASMTMAFQNPIITIDSFGGFLLDLDIVASGYANAYISFLCVDYPLGSVTIKPVDGTKAFLTIAFYPSVNSSGLVTFKSTLRRISVGEYDVCVETIGTAFILAMIGGLGVLIDILLNVAIKKIISGIFPGALKDAIRQTMGANEWKIVDGAAIADPLKMFGPIAPFDVVDSKSLLASVIFKG